MANVFTRRSNLPRTVTLSDFGFRSQKYVPEKPNSQNRVHSPTRKQNPRPGGLSFQSPYNRHNQSFAIWNPDPMDYQRKRFSTYYHLAKTNFTCNHNPDFLESRVNCSKSNTVPSFPCVNQGSSGTIQRDTYKWPDNHPPEFGEIISYTRFGNSPKYPAVGIAPNTLASARIPAVVDKTTTVENLLKMEAGRKKLPPIEGTQSMFSS